MYRTLPWVPLIHDDAPTQPVGFHADVSVLIPAKNEAQNLPWVLSRIPVEWEVVLIDGNSSDGTVAVATQYRPDIVLADQSGPGKGAAVLAGMRAARGRYVIILDADGSMDPVDMYAIVGALRAGADVVKGSRCSAGAGSEDLTKIRDLGNRALTTAFNLLYRQRLTDLTYGYLAFTRDALDGIDADGLIDADSTIPAAMRRWLGLISRNGYVGYGQGFDIETLLLTRASQAGMRICEVSCFERHRMFGDSNLGTFRDGFRILTALIYERRTSLWRTRRSHAFGPRPDISSNGIANDGIDEIHTTRSSNVAPAIPTAGKIA